MKQRASHVFFYDRKPKRIIVDVLQGSANLTEESKTAHPLPQVVLTPPRGFSDIGLRLRANEGASLHQLVRLPSSAVSSFSSSSQFLP